VDLLTITVESLIFAPGLQHTLLFLLKWSVVFPPTPLWVSKCRCVHSECAFQQHFV